MANLNEQGDLISIIVPVYNAEKCVAECIKSIVGQTYRNLEILLIDDGSKDNSGVICDEFAQNDKRIKVFHTPNGGVSRARNLGIDNVHGEFFAFVDSDDTVDTNMYDELYRKIKSDNTDICICGYKDISENHKRIINVYDDGINTTEQIWAKLLNNFYNTCIFLFVPWNKLFRKTILNNKPINGNISYLRFLEDLRYHEDFVFTFECVHANKNGISFLNITPYNFLTSNNPNSNTKIIRTNLDTKAYDYIEKVILASYPNQELKEKQIINEIECQKAVAQVFVYHTAYINNNKVEKRIGFNTVAYILKHSKNYKEKISSILILISHPLFYRFIFRLYCKVFGV